GKRRTIGRVVLALGAPRRNRRSKHLLLDALVKAFHLKRDDRLAFLAQHNGVRAAPVRFPSLGDGILEILAPFARLDEVIALRAQPAELVVPIAIGAEVVPESINARRLLFLAERYRMRFAGMAYRTVNARVERRAVKAVLLGPVLANVATAPRF